MNSGILDVAVYVLFIANFFVEECSNARVKEFYDIDMATCTTPSTEKYVIKFPGPFNFTLKNNIAYFHENFTVLETIQEPLELAVLAHRCTLDMKTCEAFHSLSLSRICTMINDENGMLASFFRTMEPQLRCPIQPGLYRFANTTMDLRFFTTFPIEGYRWQAQLKLNSKGKSKNELYCLGGTCAMKWVKKP